MLAPYGSYLRWEFLFTRATDGYTVQLRVTDVGRGELVATGSDYGLDDRTLGLTAEQLGTLFVGSQGPVGAPEVVDTHQYTGGCVVSGGWPGAYRENC